MFQFSFHNIQLQQFFTYTLHILLHLYILLQTDEINKVED